MITSSVFSICHCAFPHGVIYLVIFILLPYLASELVTNLSDYFLPFLMHGGCHKFSDYTAIPCYMVSDKFSSYFPLLYFAFMIRDNSMIASSCCILPRGQTQS